jgi:hypothetical protein
MAFIDQIPMNRLDFGLDPSTDLRSVWPPDGQPGYGENDGFWFYDEGQGIGVHAWLGHSGAEYPQAFERMTIFLPDGEVYVKATRGPQHTEAAPSGPHMWVRCDQPFERWSLGYDGPVFATSDQELRRRPPPSDRETTPVYMEAWARMIAPAFPQGAFYENREDYKAAPTYPFFGGFRFEQPLTADARLRIGDKWHRISGPGLRTHRKGVRAMASKPGAPTAKYVGHRWMHAIFPSGRAIFHSWFGGVDGVPIEGGEAYVRQDGIFYRAEVLNPMPMRLNGRGDTWPIEFKSALGVTRIEAEIIADSYQTMMADEFFGVQWNAANPDALAMSQAFVRYRWDGETAINMMERSIGVRTLDGSGND